MSSSVRGKVVITLMIGTKGLEFDIIQYRHFFLSERESIWILQCYVNQAKSLVRK